MYRRKRAGIRKRDAKLAAQGTTAGKELQKQKRAAAFRGAIEQNPNRGTKWQKPTSEAQDAAAGQKKPKKPPQADTLF